MVRKGKLDFLQKRFLTLSGKVLYGQRGIVGANLDFKADSRLQFCLLNEAVQFCLESEAGRFCLGNEAVQFCLGIAGVPFFLGNEAVQVCIGIAGVPFFLVTEAVQVCIGIVGAVKAEKLREMEQNFKSMVVLVLTGKVKNQIFRVEAFVHIANGSKEHFRHGN